MSAKSDELRPKPFTERVAGERLVLIFVALLLSRRLLSHWAFASRSWRTLSGKPQAKRKPNECRV
jgi:hypothetical protein